MDASAPAPTICGERPAWMGSGVLSGQETSIDATWFVEARKQGVFLRGPAPTQEILLSDQAWVDDAVFDATNGVLWLDRVGRILVVDLALARDDPAREREVFTAPDSLARRPHAFGVRYQDGDGPPCTLGSDVREGEPSRVVVTVERSGAVTVNARERGRKLRSASMTLERGLERPACTQHRRFPDNASLGSRMQLGSLPYEIEIVGLGRGFAHCMLRDTRDDTCAPLVRTLNWAPLDTYEYTSASHCLGGSEILSADERAFGFAGTLCFDAACEALVGDFLGFVCGQTLVGGHDGKPR